MSLFARNICISLIIVSMACATFEGVKNALSAWGPVAYLIASVAALVVAYIASALIAMWLGR